MKFFPFCCAIASLICYFRFQSCGIMDDSTTFSMSSGRLQKKSMPVSSSNLSMLTA